MARRRVIAVLLLLAGLAIGYFVYYSQTNTSSSWSRPFKLGLDLKGGSQLIYIAKTDSLKPGDINSAMTSLKAVIERRVNVFGVTEPVVLIETAGVGAGTQNRLVVELPGETDLDRAVAQIGKTPLLDFRTERPDGPEKDAIIAQWKQVEEIVSAMGTSTSPDVIAKLTSSLQNPNYIETELTGKYISRAAVDFQSQTVGPAISLQFTSDGAKIFADLTKANVEKTIGIFLDGNLISAPVVREAITDGKAQISGQFTLDEAKQLVSDLNLGALPVPIELSSTQTIGATLGYEAMEKGINSALIGFLVIALFMVLWYRVPGLISVITLSIYISIVLAIFKLIPVTITAAGIAGFILSLGIAVDANVLIFERLKEELMRGKTIRGALEDGFGRAWTSIRDSNLSTVITAVILFWFGTSLIKGFALNLIIGVAVSMFTAITLSRTFLLCFNPAESKMNRFLFSSGFNSGTKKE